MSRANVLRFACAACVGVATFACAATASAQEAKEPKSFYIVPKFGLLISGGGDVDCSSSNVALCRGRAYSPDDKSDPAFGVDFLATVSRNVRVGGGLLYVTSSKYSVQGFTQSVGNDLSLVGIVEGVFPVSPIVSLAARAQLGAILLFTGGALKDQINADQSACAGACTVSSGPYGGFTWGFGGGGIFDVGPLGLRADLLYQGISSLTLEKATGAVEGTLKYSGHRFWFLIGGDIGL